MKTIILKVDESIFGKVMDFLSLLPEDKLKVSMQADGGKTAPIEKKEKQVEAEDEIDKILNGSDCFKVWTKETLINN